MFLKLRRAGDPDPIHGEHVYVRSGSFKKIIRVNPPEGKPSFTFIGFGMTNQLGHEMGEAVQETPETVILLDRFAGEQSMEEYDVGYTRDCTVSGGTLTVISSGCVCFNP